MDRNPALRDSVLSRLQQGWSPEQVAERLAREAGRRVICHETIYRFIYAQVARKKDYSWRQYLPRGKSKRGRQGRKRKGPVAYIHLRRPLSERPREAKDRLTPGHWDADLMLFGNRGQSLMVLHERHSRLLLAAPQSSKAAGPIASSMFRMLADFPAEWRRTVTFDNGTEFAQHYKLHELGVETFFCDTRSPWQKGGAENSIGRMRRFLPGDTDLAALPADELIRLLQAHNNTPRKCLGYQTPAELFSYQVLHLKCESTLRFLRARRPVATILVGQEPVRAARDEIESRGYHLEDWGNAVIAMLWPLPWNTRDTVRVIAEAVQADTG